MTRAFLAFVCLLGVAALPALAADDAALIAADDARVAAMLAADRSKLEVLLSDELHYAHSSGTVDTKPVFLDLLASGKTRYLGYEHVERRFSLATPGVALMTGRARIQAQSARGTMDSVLAYLAVWRLEEGRWRFLAWQSCRLPTEEPAAAK
jgi:hypothetical protein